MDGSWHRLPRLLAALLWLALLSAHASDERLLDIESRLRGRPVEALAALAQVMPSVAEGDRVEALALQGWLHVRRFDAAGAEQTALALEALAAKAPNPLTHATAGLVRARALSHPGPLGRADRIVTEAWARLPASAPPLLRLRFVETRADIKQRMGKLDEAVALCQEAVTMADSLAIDWRRAEHRTLLAYSLWAAQQIDRAAAVNTEALAIARASGDALAMYAGLNIEGFITMTQGRTEDELRAMRGAVDYARQAGAKREEAVATTNLSDYYLKRGDNATALAVARKALPVAREIKDPGLESVALANAGLALIAMGRAAEGLPLSREALKIQQNVGALTDMSIQQEELGAALEKAGLLKEAWQALSEHRKLADEMFRREHQQAVLELQEGFDAERRQRDLARLGTENNLKEAQLLNRELQQKLWALGVVAGALVLAAVGLLLRRMWRSNTLLQSSNALLKVAGEVDPLTGLANRRHFLDTMQTITAAGPFEGSLLLIDIDHFKRINDQHGHAAGDAVLVELARRLRLALRGEDLTVRWGGEEFLILVRAQPQAQVEALAERLLVTIGGDPVKYEKQTIAVTASIGFATFPLQPALHPIAWERAIDLVDTAMYLAKAHGRNRAYGVRSLESEAGAPPAEAGALETAWRAGRADLKAVSGPAALVTEP